MKIKDKHFKKIEELLVDSISIYDYSGIFTNGFSVEPLDDDYYNVKIEICNKKTIELEFTFEDNEILLVGCNGDCEYPNDICMKEHLFIEIVGQLVC